jgi:YfiR/HmsC-like
VAPLGRYARALVALLLAGSLVTSAARAQENLRLVEQDVKAGLLYNFLRYTEWPGARSSGAAIVCIYGSDPFSGRLQPMAGRTVNQRTIQLRTVREPAEMDACSLLYVNAEERARWPRLRSYLTQRNVLTVSDYDGFATSGGMIEFTHANNRIGVRINVSAMEAANLTVQDRLLRLASVVGPTPQ